MSPVGAFKCCIAACPSAGSSPAEQIQDLTPPLIFPLPSLLFLPMQVGATQAPGPVRVLCWAGDVVLWLHSPSGCFGEVVGRRPTLPLPGSRLRGRPKISHQIMKPSLIARESE